MMIDEQVNLFLRYLHLYKNASQHTINSYRADIQAFIGVARAEYVDEVLFSNVTAYVARSYVNYLMKSNYSQSTMARHIAALRTFFKFLLDQGQVIVNPFAGIYLPQSKSKQPIILNTTEIEALLALPDDSTLGLRDKAILELLYATGMRASELISLTCDQVDTVNRYTIIKGRGNKERIVPIGRQACNAIENYLLNSRNILCKKCVGSKQCVLFVNRQGNPLSDRSIRRIIAKYMSGLANKSISPSTLRHSFALHLLSNGADLNSVRELMGVSNLSVLKCSVEKTKDSIQYIYKNSHPRA